MKWSHGFILDSVCHLNYSCHVVATEGPFNRLLLGGREETCNTKSNGTEGLWDGWAGRKERGGGKRGGGKRGGERVSYCNLLQK